MFAELGGLYFELSRVMAVMLKRDPSFKSSLMIAVPTFPPGCYWSDELMVPFGREDRHTPRIAMFLSCILIDVDL